MHHSPENRGAYVDNQKCSFLWSCQNVKRTSPLRSSRRDGQKTYMECLIRSPDEEVMPSKRCSVVESSDSSRDFRLLKVSTGVGTSGKPEETCSGVWGNPHVGSSDKGRKFRLSGVLTQVGTSNGPNLKPCSDLAFWILIWTILNSWETWKISLGEVSY